MRHRLKSGRRKHSASGNDVAIVACGILVYNALIAAEELAREDGIEARVINNHTIKPMDDAAIVEAARACGAVVTVEEHQVHGGMGSAVAETLAAHAPVPIEFIGVQDRFGQSGDPVELIEHYGMGTAAIKEAVRRALSPVSGYKRSTFEPHCSWVENTSKNDLRCDGRIRGLRATHVRAALGSRCARHRIGRRVRLCEPRLEHVHGADAAQAAGSGWQLAVHPSDLPTALIDFGAGVRSQEPV